MLTITQHAIDRFREKTSSTKTNEQLAKHMLKMANKSQEAEFTKPHYKVLALLNHDYNEATYLIDPCGGVFVVVDNVIVTYHRNEAKRWRAK